MDGMWPICIDICRMTYANGINKPFNMEFIYRFCVTKHNTHLIINVYVIYVLCTVHACVCMCACVYVYDMNIIWARLISLIKIKGKRTLPPPFQIECTLYILELNFKSSLIQYYTKKIWTIGIADKQTKNYLWMYIILIVGEVTAFRFPFLPLFTYIWLSLFCCVVRSCLFLLPRIKYH